MRDNNSSTDQTNQPSDALSKNSASMDKEFGFSKKNEFPMDKKSIYYTQGFDKDHIEKDLHVISILSIGLEAAVKHKQTSGEFHGLTDDSYNVEELDKFIHEHRQSIYNISSQYLRKSE